MNSDFSIAIDNQKIATITWNCEKKSMNVLSFEALETLEKLIDLVIEDKNIIACMNRYTSCGMSRCVNYF